MSSSDTPRSVLPIPARAHAGLTTYDAKDPDTSYPPIQQLRPPAGAPNVLVVLLDDAGFGSGTPISDDYTSADATFNGKVKWVQLDAALDDHDHLITPQERFRVAMAVQ